MKDICIRQFLAKAEEIAEDFHERHGSIDESEISYELSEWFINQEGVEDFFFEQYGKEYDVIYGKLCTEIVSMYFHSKDYENLLIREAEYQRDEIERKKDEQVLKLRSY